MNKLILFILVAIVYGEAPAPYPPSGWRPAGQPFTLPSRQQFQPEYGAPASTAQAINSQYLPSVQPAGSSTGNNFAFNQARPSYESLNPSNFNQQRSNGQQPNTLYTPNVDPTNNGASDTNNPAITGFPQRFTPNNINQQRPNGQEPNTLYTSDFDSTNRMAGNNNPTVPQQFNGNNIPSESFAPSRRPNLKNKPVQQFGNIQNMRGNLQFDPEGSRRFQNFAQAEDFSKQTGVPQNTRRFNQVENFNQEVQRDNINDSDEDEPKEFKDNRQFASQNDFDDMVYNTPSKEYGASLTTTTRPVKPTAKKPTVTTPRPETSTEVTDGEDFDQPNVAIATAVASGQYYVLQPDGRLQRVVFMTLKNPDGDSGGGFTANLMYEDVEPIKGPIFTYSDSPLVRLNK